MVAPGVEAILSPAGQCVGEGSDAHGIKANPEKSDPHRYVFAGYCYRNMDAVAIAQPGGPEVIAAAVSLRSSAATLRPPFARSTRRLTMSLPLNSAIILQSRWVWLATWSDCVCQNRQRFYSGYARKQYLPLFVLSTSEIQPSFRLRRSFKRSVYHPEKIAATLWSNSLDVYMPRLPSSHFTRPKESRCRMLPAETIRLRRLD